MQTLFKQFVFRSHRITRDALSISHNEKGMRHSTIRGRKHHDQIMAEKKIGAKFAQVRFANITSNKVGKNEKEAYKNERVVFNFKLLFQQQKVGLGNSLNRVLTLRVASSVHPLVASSVGFI